MKAVMIRLAFELLWLALVVLGVKFFMESPDQAEAMFRQATLINISEAALYALGALALFFAAVYLKALAEDRRMMAADRGQRLEFITREFESRFGERSQYDPRPAPSVTRRPIGR